MKLSVIIISYKSDHLLNNLLKYIPKKYQIIIVENSRSFLIKKKIEKKFKNTKVIIPEINLGYARAFNKAFKECRNKKVLTLTPDVIINKKLIKNLENIIKKFKDFYLIAPEYKNQKIYKNYENFSQKQTISFKINNFMVQNVKELDWCFCILNKQKFKNFKVLDENYFMYFETTDLCKKLVKKNLKMFVIKNLKFEHKGTSSTNKIYDQQILYNRNWHFSWSKFYFFRKNYNYLYALRKVLPNIFQGLYGILFSLFKINLLEVKLHIASLSGFINSIFLNKSSFRIKLR